MAGGKAKAPKPAPPGTPRRPAGGQPSPVDPEHAMPARAVAWGDFTPEGQSLVAESMAQAGINAYGHPITMDDAVATKRSYIEAAIDAAPSGIPEGVAWYSGHQAAYRDIARDTGSRIGRTIDLAGHLSTRNSPQQERRAARSAAFIAANPGHKVTITREMLPHFSSSDVQAGSVSLGELSDRSVAEIGYAETQALKSLGQVDKQGNALRSARFIPRDVSGVTLDSAGRDVATRTMGVARGGAFTGGPKVTNYVRATHQANDAEDRYNREVLFRRANTPKYTDPETGETWQQGHLWSAGEMTGFGPEEAIKAGVGESVQDYIENAQVAEAAIRKGNSPKAPRKAQEDIKAPKLKTGTFPADLDADEIRHAFNEETTARAARLIGATSHTQDGSLYEWITPRAAQGIGWTHFRRHALNEDKEYNREQKAQAEAAAKAAKAPKPDTSTLLKLFED